LRIAWPPCRCPKKIDQLAAEVFTYMKGIVDLNPVEATPKDVVAILQNSLQ